MSANIASNKTGREGGIFFTEFMGLKIRIFDAMGIGSCRLKAGDGWANGIHVHDKNALILFDVNALETIHLGITLMLR